MDEARCLWAGVPPKQPHAEALNAPQCCVCSCVVQTIRKQAADLRFILEAPELEIGADERVTLPVLSDSMPGQYRRVLMCLSLP